MPQKHLGMATGWLSCSHLLLRATKARGQSEPAVAIYNALGIGSGGRRRCAWDNFAELAVEGGAPVRTRPFPPRAPFGPADAQQVLEALDQQ